MVTTVKPNATVVTRAQKSKNGRDSRLYEVNTPDKALPLFLTKHQIRKIREQRQRRHLEKLTVLVTSPPSRTPGIKIRMHIFWQYA